MFGRVLLYVLMLCRQMLILPNIPSRICTKIEKECKMNIFILKVNHENHLKSKDLIDFILVELSYGYFLTVSPFSIMIHWFNG